MVAAAAVIDVTAAVIDVMAAAVAVNGGGGCERRRWL